MLKDLLYLALFILVTWTILFQLLGPYLLGTPFFPFFRSKKIRTLEEQIVNARQDVAAKDLQNKLNKLNTKTEK